VLGGHCGAEQAGGTPQRCELGGEVGEHGLG
jgi:hypothetical protein